MRYLVVRGEGRGKNAGEFARVLDELLGKHEAAPAIALAKGDTLQAGAIVYTVTSIRPGYNVERGDVHVVELQVAR